MPEGGVNFRIALAAGQKTGWYFYQTANRAMLARHVRDARVLDVFSYAGGFGLQAKRAGASQVTCIDSSAPALEMAAATQMVEIAVRKMSPTFNKLSLVSRPIRTGGRLSVAAVSPASGDRWRRRRLTILFRK